MSTIELPYAFGEVETKEQAQLFIAQVLIPASDIIAGCSFLESGLFQVSREQTLVTRDAPGCWTSIGFQALRLQPADDPGDILYNLTSHNANDTTQFPFSERALQAAAMLASDNQFGEDIIERVLGREIDEDDEIEYEDEVVEQHEYYLNNRSLSPYHDTDFAYRRNGVTVWMDSAEASAEEDQNPVAAGGYQDLLEKEDELTSTFDVFDLQNIAEILRRLGLVAA